MAKDVISFMYEEVARGELCYLTIKFNMTKMFKCARVYTKERPEVRWDNVYGITTFELG